MKWISQFLEAGSTEMNILAGKSDIPETTRRQGKDFVNCDT